MTRVVPEDLLPVDILIDKTTIKILCTSTQELAVDDYLQHLDPELRPKPTTLQEYFLDLPETLHQICGNVTFPEDGGRSLAEAALQGDILGIIDSSVHRS